MGAKNRVIAGDYNGKVIMQIMGQVCISLNFTETRIIDKFEVESYEVINEDITKSAASGITRGAVGAALLGPVGLLAGLSAKNKGVYNIAIKFKDGKNSLIEVDDKIYKTLIKTLF